MLDSTHEVAPKERLFSFVVMENAWQLAVITKEILSKYNSYQCPRRPLTLIACSPQILGVKFVVPWVRCITYKLLGNQTAKLQCIG